MFYGIGSSFQEGGWAREFFGAAADGTKVVAHGLAGGVMSVLNGGKFGNGFISAGFTQLLAPGIGKIDKGTRFSPKWISAASIVGGTSSAMTGGKFANGAQTAAFSRAFNDESHWEKTGTSTLGRFIKDEGWGVITRTLQIFGGGGQVLAGVGMCSLGAGVSGVLSCVGGGLIAAKGIDNIQAGWRGTDTFSQQVITSLTGSEDTGLILNSGLDLGVSAYGAFKAVNIISDLGVKQVYFGACK